MEEHWIDLKGLKKSIVMVHSEPDVVCVCRLSNDCGIHDHFFTKMSSLYHCRKVAV
jgi:hypothetical protein